MSPEEIFANYARIWSSPTVENFERGGASISERLGTGGVDIDSHIGGILDYELFGHGDVYIDGRLDPGAQDRNQSQVMDNCRALIENVK